MIEFTIGSTHLKLWAGQVLGVLMLGAYVFLLWRAQRSKSNPIDLATMFVWPGTQQTSVAAVMAFGAFLAATWAIIDMQMRSKLTEGYFTAYLGACLLGKALTEGWNAWGSRAPTPPAQNTTQMIDKAAVVTSAPAPDPPPAVPPNQAAAPTLPRKHPRARKRAKPKGQRK